MPAQSRSRDRTTNSHDHVRTDGIDAAGLSPRATADAAPRRYRTSARLDPRVLILIQGLHIRIISSQT